jgi:Calx-beta domain
VVKVRSGRFVGRVSASLAVASIAVIVGVGGMGRSSGLPFLSADLKVSASTTGLTYVFGAPPIAPAGSIGPGASVNFTVKVRNNGVTDPGGAVYLSYNSPASGDALTVPASQCGGTSRLSRTPVLCTANTAGQVPLTYTAPPQPPGAAVVLFTAGNAASNPSSSAVDHYVYATNYRFASSPIAASGHLTAGASVGVTLSAENAADQGIPNDTVYLSFTPTAGGGSASITGGAALNGTPTLYHTNASGLISLTYRAPATLPATGADAIVVQDLQRSPQVTNTDSYAFAATTPVISVGDTTVTEGDVKPGIPAEFTVTIQPVQATPVTVQYTTLCGIGDKGCEEDYIQVLQPASFTIPAHASSTKVILRWFSYIGGNGGENYIEGGFIHIANPSVGVLGRSVGEGVLLADVESAKTVFHYLYAGGAALVPTAGSSEPMYFTIALGAPQSSTLTFTYATTDGTALAGRDYTAASGTASIAAGTTSAVIPVTLLANSPPSASRTFTLTISNASGGITISRATATGTVLAS